MKLVINVPDYIKEQADDGKAEEFGIPRWLAYEIANGTPFPKGHGRLGDLDAVMSDISTSINAMTNIGIAVDGEYLWAKLNDAIYNAQTIIEADNGESEE